MIGAPPLSWLTPRATARAFAVSSAVSIAWMGLLNALGAPLANATAPLGIVSFELAGDLDTARGMLASWQEPGRLRAALSLGLDFVFLVAYSISIALGCVVVARRLAASSAFGAALGPPLAYAQFGAAGLDALENLALIRLLLGSEQALWAPLAFACAVPKFAIVAAGLLYVASGFAVSAVANARRRGRASGSRP